jgi:hypothetical protein
MVHLISAAGAGFTFFDLSGCQGKRETRWLFADAAFFMRKSYAEGKA